MAPVAHLLAGSGLERAFQTVLRLIPGNHGDISQNEFKMQH